MRQNNLDKQYTDLLQDILDNGVVKGDRTGTGTISVFGRQIRHKMSEGFPLLTTKKMPFKSIVTELLWFLRGDTNIKYLVDNGCNIWNGDAYKNYLKGYGNNEVAGIRLSDNTIREATIDEFIRRIKVDDEFAKKWGDLGPIYGKQWRDWGGYTSTSHQKMNGENGIHITGINQISNLVDELRNNPDSRRLMVNAWNVGELGSMVLPPCHYGFQVYTRKLSPEEKYTPYPDLLEVYVQKNIHIKNQEFAKAAEARGREVQLLNELPNIPTRAISLMWNQRSVDTFLGLPFNIASYGLLLEILAKQVNMVPDELIGNLGDVHLYSNHIEQAKEQIGRDLTIKERYDLWENKENKDALFTFNEYKNDERKQHIFLSSRHQGEVSIRTREPFLLPTLKVNDAWKYSSKSPYFGDNIELRMFELVDYKSHGVIKAPLSN